MKILTTFLFLSLFLSGYSQPAPEKILLKNIKFKKIKKEKLEGGWPFKKFIYTFKSKQYGKVKLITASSIVGRKNFTELNYQILCLKREYTISLTRIPEEWLSNGDKFNVCTAAYMVRYGEYKDGEYQLSSPTQATSSSDKLDPLALCKIDYVQWNGSLWVVNCISPDCTLIGYNLENAICPCVEVEQEPCE